MFYGKATLSYVWSFLLASAGRVLACPDYHFEDSINGSQNATLNERWYTILDSPGQVVQPWPKSTLPYCFADDNSRTQLAAIVIGGWKIWQDA